MYYHNSLIVGTKFRTCIAEMAELDFAVLTENLDIFVVWDLYFGWDQLKLRAVGLVDATNPHFEHITLIERMMLLPLYWKFH